MSLPKPANMRALLVGALTADVDSQSRYVAATLGPYSAGSAPPQNVGIHVRFYQGRRWARLGRFLPDFYKTPGVEHGPILASDDEELS